MANVEVTKDKLMAIAAQVISEKAMLMAEPIVDLIIRKNHDYGDAWQRYGIFTPLIRINDKILRVQTLSSGMQAMVAGESILDTIKDIVAYGLLALLKLTQPDLLNAVQLSLPIPGTVEEQAIQNIVKATDD